MSRLVIDYPLTQFVSICQYVEALYVTLVIAVTLLFELV